MSVTESAPAARIAHEVARSGAGGATASAQPSHAAWRSLRSLGTELWLDTGDLDAAGKIWSPEFSNLTTNNTLVNTEVQKGVFDEVIKEAGRRLRDECPELSEDELVIEAGFVVNCRSALRLVEAFDATVSVELHPAMADDAARSVEFGRRYHAVCPEKFIVKVPMTPAGFLAARKLVEDGIPINYTLGFSARQNVLAAAFTRVDFVNVFLGRLNSFVSEHGLGDGENVGEKTCLATQRAIREGRAGRGWRTRLIAASMRSGDQVYDLAGVDVFTMPTKAAGQFLQSWEAGRQDLSSRVDSDPRVVAEPAGVVDLLWEVDAAVYELTEALADEDSSEWTGADFQRFVRSQGPGNLFYPFTQADLAEIRRHGKIPDWSRWEPQLRSGELALDNLMSVSALMSFVTDQAELDDRIRRLLRDRE